MSDSAPRRPDARRRDLSPGHAGPTRVVIVDGYPAQLRRLRGVLHVDAGIDVVGEAYSGAEAIMLVDRIRPDAVLMSLDLPDGDGVATLEAIMADRPTPVVVHAAVLAGADWSAAVMAAGAVDIVSACVGLDAAALGSYGRDLQARLHLASRVRVITHPRGRLRGEASPGSRPDDCLRGARPAAAGVPRQGARTDQPVRLIAIGASTGGPAALVTVLGALPADFDAAVLVLQHMVDGFIEGLADWLDSMVALPVSVACSGRHLQPGRVVVAPSGANLLVRDRLLVVCEPAPLTQYHVPGIDLAFGSIARALGSQAVGVLLTGMGRDGASGMRALRDVGATTIGQDEQTSAVYGMPAAAAALDAVVEQLPLPAIGPRLLELVAARRPADHRPADHRRPAALDSGRPR